jgi:uncharacterized protein (TIGR01777 family)
MSDETCRREDRAARESLTVAVTGASGLIGSALVRALRDRGDRVLRLVRRDAPGENEVYWKPARGEIDGDALEGADAVVHLAGENLASGLWTHARRIAIRKSRTDGTRLLAETLASLANKPRVLVSASAVGYYGDTGDEPATEESPPGKGFLADVCREWEAAADPARRAGIRVVHPRFGVVLSPKGGALSKMLLPFRLGLGGPIGSGEQYMSCVSLTDGVRAILHVVGDDAIEGPVNVVVPEAAKNDEFTKTLGRVLHRPTFLRVPAFAISLLLGRMGRETLLASVRVRPERLAASGFDYRAPDLESALRRELGRPEE